MKSRNEKIYLRTIISAHNEIKFIKLHLAESEGYVDCIIVCEYDCTHSGEPRDYIFEQYLKNGTFTKEEKDRIIYVQGKVRHLVKKTHNNAKYLHKNEKLFRGYFAHHVRLKLNDIIITVDADEIIFRRSYDEILSNFKRPNSNPIIRLKLWQFFYKPTYLWTDIIIQAPVACRVKRKLFQYPAQWRDEGKLMDNIVGCHFSWFLTIDEMIEKLHSYAHAADYGHLAEVSILQDAVENKKYPFDESRDFHIKEVDYINNPEYYPDTYAKFKREFDYLL